MKCSTCGAERVVTVWQGIKIGARTIVWHLCVECWRKEQKQ